MYLHDSISERDLEIIEEKKSKNISLEISGKERRKLEPIARKLIKTIFHFFPKFSMWLKEIKDLRNPKKIKYPMEVIMWSGLFLFILQLEARRQIHYSLGNEEGLENIKNSVGFNKLPHGDTVRDALKKVPVEELENLRLKLIRTLLRKKVFSGLRLLNNYYLVAIDGTELYKFKERHCEHCLTREFSNGTVQYHHQALEAKLVFPNGISISIDTEFIENEKPDVKKQDCETKAFYRLSSRLKKNFPQLRICILLDSLYAQQNVLSICENNKWRYIINFKEGSIPSVAEEFEALSKLQQENNQYLKKENIEQSFRWVTEIEYKGHFLYALNLVEVEFYKRTGQEKVRRYFLWITDFKVNRLNYFQIANYGGRIRWKIENEGFNDQKNWGYNLEHVFAHHYNAMKNFYILLQLGHLINQLLIKGSLISKELIKKYGGIMALLKRLKSQFIYSYTDFTGLEEFLKKPIQIRFYWDQL
jgi:hypothetical protein